MPMLNTLGSSSVAGSFVHPGVPASKSQRTDDVVLRGLVGRGHGLDAISTFLRLGREDVMEWVVRMDLPTPHNRPMRRISGPKAWLAGDYFRFIECWVAGWH